MSITQISDFTLRHMIENDKRDKEFQQKQIDRIRQLENELADKDRQLAEITRQRNAYKKALEMAEDELMTVRAEIERLTLLAQNQDIVIAAQRRSAVTKNKLIEQMREALKLALPEARSTHVEQTILAALAAERGE